MERAFAGLKEEPETLAKCVFYTAGSVLAELYIKLNFISLLFSPQEKESYRGLWV